MGDAVPLRKWTSIVLIHRQVLFLMVMATVELVYFAVPWP